MRLRIRRRQPDCKNGEGGGLFSGTYTYAMILLAILVAFGPLSIAEVMPKPQLETHISKSCYDNKNKLLELVGEISLIIPMMSTSKVMRRSLVGR